MLGKPVQPNPFKLRRSWLYLDEAAQLFSEMTGVDCDPQDLLFLA